jgi:hypothetical protein
MKLNTHSLRINIIIFLASLVFSNYAYAEEFLYEDAYSNATEYTLESTSTPWSLLAGESLSDLARLLYPNSKQMQKRFISKSLQLSRHIQPNLNPSDRADQMTVIIIPNIKFLGTGSAKSKDSRTNLVGKQAKNYASQDALAPNATQQKAYDYLLIKNTFLKEELIKLNAKLLALVELLASLKIELMRLLAQVDIQSAQVPSTASAGESSIESAALGHHVAGSVTNASPKAAKYLLQPILTVLFVLSLFLALAFFNQQQKNFLNPRNVYLRAKRSYGNMKAELFNDNSFLKTKRSPTIFASDFPLEPVVKSEYSGSMIVTDLSDVGIPHFEDDAAQALEQAKIFLAIQREDEAIKLLKAQISAAPKATLQHWLLLLDIYRKTNQKAEFMQYAKLLHENFNVMMPSWDSSTLPSAINSSLEAFAHISTKMTQLWANCEKEAQKISQTKSYLDELLLDNRNNERSGFSFEVFKEIILLRDMLDVREKLEFAD